MPQACGLPLIFRRHGHLRRAAAPQTVHSVLAVPPKEECMPQFMYKPSYGIRSVTEIVVIVTGQQLNPLRVPKGIQARNLSGERRAQGPVWKMNQTPGLTHRADK